MDQYIKVGASTNKWVLTPWQKWQKWLWFSGISLVQWKGRSGHLCFIWFIWRSAGATPIYGRGRTLVSWRTGCNNSWPSWIKKVRNSDSWDKRAREPVQHANYLPEGEEKWLCTIGQFINIFVAVNWRTYNIYELLISSVYHQMNEKLMT